MHVSGLVERDDPDHQGHDGERHHDEEAGNEVPSAEWSAVFVEGRAGGDLRYHPCTVRAGPAAGFYQVL